MAKARVIITPKKTIMDAQGQTIKNALHSLGYTGVGSVRMGKVLEVEVDAAAAGQLDEMCQKLLANPIIEDYRIELEG
jgi:phosphoribosylformylglycinamidine synthase subunit PurS